MGGGTFWGLGSLLTKARGFDELLHLASEGDHRNVDLLVKDIYGMQPCMDTHLSCSYLAVPVVLRANLILFITYVHII